MPKTPINNTKDFSERSDKLPYLDLLSDHLFWDVNKKTLDIQKSKKTIVHRVLDYGLLKDWKILVHLYGIEEIAKVAMKIPDLEKKSANLIAFLSNTSIKNFACYSSKQSTPPHWNF
ncbi:DUF6922 domain-containing protein [Thermophagus xiamenensis]|jgi:hypothetical protein|uniref:DUF6922 domain-containing protein n=1 Tax=Thermophagus xiamenensis TaxID=385682 RepID=A0A1I2ETJ0_9BACT|nr:hypothetical protein [Thermophagus xiamenensis]SFE96145.1 hypothetical protein SAMN05444380_12436 [Thermophagus xiamenensis]